MNTTPLTIPLVKGLDQSKDPAVGTDDLDVAENVDYSKDGVVRGRPGRTTPKQFMVRSTSTTYAADAAFTGLGFSPSGLLALRDNGGERAALACEGRLFSQEPTRWVDRGPFACGKVDRLFNYVAGLDGDGSLRSGARLRSRVRGIPRWP
jgi:hypothetical protein